MSIESKNHRPSPVKQVLASQGSHGDARPVNGLKFETYREEQEYWVSQKKQTEAELTGYSKAAFAAEQARIRREHRGDQNASFRAWMSRKASMEDRRVKLAKSLARIEGELIRLKPLVKAENKRMKAEEAKQGPGRLDGFELFREDGTLVWDAVAAQILIELREVRRLLEESLSLGVTDAREDSRRRGE